ncbi:MAG: hypothetical protein ABSD21_07820 [Rhizomicrobium sp.]|jgi:hypothetical protein
MTNAKWDGATTEEKLEMLREDIRHISDYHNALGREVRQQTQALHQEIEELKRMFRSN